MDLSIHHSPGCISGTVCACLYLLFGQSPKCDALGWSEIITLLSKLLSQDHSDQLRELSKGSQHRLDVFQVLFMLVCA